MKHFLLIEIFLPLIFAVDRCPIYRESGWKLVRRTTDNSFAATDNLDGTDVYGPEHENVFGWFDISPFFNPFHFLIPILILIDKSWKTYPETFRKLKFSRS